MRLVVVCAPALADGFRLAGVATAVADPGGNAASIVQSLAAQPDVGLVMVTDDVWQTVPERARVSLESLARPIVLGIPAGTGAGLDVDLDAVRGGAAIGEVLQRAIGHRIELSGSVGRGEGTP